MDQSIPISALQHYAYCPRQCALIYMEQVWSENLYTLRGHRAHENVDVPERMVREGLRVERALPLWSERLGLSGRADVVEFVDGVPYPVEHKVGSKWAKKADEIQLCAQGLCLEEMFEIPVLEGALFYKRSQRRREVVFDLELRTQTLAIIDAVRLLLRQDQLPPPVADARCPNCSLIDTCMPEIPAALAALRSLDEGVVIPTLWATNQETK